MDQNRSEIKNIFASTVEENTTHTPGKSHHNSEILTITAEMVSQLIDQDGNSGHAAATAFKTPGGNFIVDE